MYELSKGARTQCGGWWDGLEAVFKKMEYWSLLGIVASVLGDDENVKRHAMGG